MSWEGATITLPTGDDEVEARRREVGELTEAEIFGVLRRRAGVPQREVASESGVTQSLVSAWESGRYKEMPDHRRRDFWAALDHLSAAAR